MLNEINRDVAGHLTVTVADPNLAEFVTHLVTTWHQRETIESSCRVTADLIVDAPGYLDSIVEQRYQEIDSRTRDRIVVRRTVAWHYEDATLTEVTIDIRTAARLSLHIGGVFVLRMEAVVIPALPVRARRESRQPNFLFSPSEYLQSDIRTATPSAAERIWAQGYHTDTRAIDLLRAAADERLRLGDDDDLSLGDDRPMMMPDGVRHRGSEDGPYPLDALLDQINSLTDE